MSQLDYLFDENHIAQNSGTPEDWAEFAAFLDEIGYDNGDDGEQDYDPDSSHGFQNLDTDYSPF